MANNNSVVFLFTVLTLLLVSCLSNGHQHHHQHQHLKLLSQNLNNNNNDNNRRDGLLRSSNKSSIALPMSSAQFLRLNSHRRNGSDHSHRYNWMEQATTCSVTCGLGVADVSYRCFSPSIGKFVADSKCDSRRRPLTVRKSCKLADCEPRWEVGMWENCSVNCGLSVVQRRVTCVRYGTGVSSSGSLFEVMSDEVCIRNGQTKPPDEKACPHQKCSHWRVSSWSRCSSSCGTGIQTRQAKCLRKLPARLPCDPLLRPPLQRLCLNSFSNQCMADYVIANSKLKQEAQRRPELVIRVQPHDLQPRFHVGDWGQCSKTCGGQSGIKYRIVQCRRYFPELRLYADVAEDECNNQPEPKSIETCKPQYIPCPKGKGNPESDPSRYKSFEWMETGFSTCSTSCGGGYRKNLVLCFGITQTNQVPVDDFNCANMTRPMERYEMCGTEACQPEWQVTNTSECSASCGIGVKYQSTRCIRKQPEVGADEELPEFMCQPHDRPSMAVSCNAGPCSPLWRAGPWSECSEACGVGWQLRNVSCILPIRTGYFEQMPDAVCEDQQQNGVIKPQPSNARRCVTLAKCTNPETLVDPSTHVYLNEGVEITHFLGGQIYAIPSSSSSLTLICPAPALASVIWYKNEKQISQQQSVAARSSSSLYHIKPILVATSGNYSCSVSFNNETKKHISVETFSSEVIIFADSTSLKNHFGFGSVTYFNWQRVDNLIFDGANSSTKDKFNFLTTAAWNKKMEASFYVSDRCQSVVAFGTSPACIELSDKCSLGCAIRRTDSETINDFGTGVSFIHKDLCQELEDNYNRLSKLLPKSTTSIKPLLQVPFADSCKSKLMPSWTMLKTGPCDSTRCLSNLDIAVVDLSVRCQPLARPDLDILYLDESYCSANERPLDYTFCLSPDCSKKRRRK